MKDLDRLGVFLAGLGIFGHALLAWLKYFGVAPRRSRRDIDWDELLS